VAFTTFLSTIRVFGNLGVYGPETAAIEVAEPVVGTVTFTPSVVLKDVTNNQVLYPNESAVVVTLTPADNGVLDVRLAATDDPQYQPTGWQWIATENFTNADGETTFSFSLPHAGGDLVRYASIRTTDAPPPDVGTGNFIPVSEKGVANGVATLDGTGRVPLAQIPGGIGGGPGGSLGGDLSGTTDNAQIVANAVGSAEIAGSAVIASKIAAGAISDTHIAPASGAYLGIAESKLNLNSDAAAGVPSRRSLGTGALQAAAGNHSHGPSGGGNIFYFDHGTNANAARPDFPVVYWGGSVDPVNRQGDDFWNDPNSVSEVDTGNPFAGNSPGSGSLLGWDNGNTRWTATQATTDTSGEAILSFNGFVGPVWSKRDTRRTITIFTPGVGPATYGLTTTLSEFLNLSLHRVRADLLAASQARICANVSSAGTAGAELRVQYSVNNGTSWAYLSQAAGTSGGATPGVSVVNVGTQVGPWATIHANAQVESALLRVVNLASGSGNVNLGLVSIETR